MKNEFRRRNLLSQKKHRVDSFWQITFPLIIGSLLIFGFAAWAVTVAVNGGQVSPAADTALIFLLIPALVTAFIFLAVLAGLVYAVIWLNINIPFYAYRLQNIFTRVDAQVQSISDKAANPVIKARSLSAALRAFAQLFRFRQ